MKKRFLCLLMALFLFASLIPLTASADEAAATEKPDAKFDFVLSGNAKAPEDDQAELVMKAGDEPKYYITAQSDPNNPTYWYLAPGSDTEWNVKFEYPADGIPTITMKDAKIINGCGLWFGGFNIKMTSDVKLVLEGTNYMGGGKYAGPMVFNTTGTATITGSGTLEFSSNSHSYQSGYLASFGDMVLDNVNITMNFPETWGRTNGLSAQGGDITMKGGSITIVAYDDPKTTHAEGKESGYERNQEAIHSAVYVKKSEDGKGGNFTVQDGAKFTVMASPTACSSNGVAINNGLMICLDGKFTIKDSTVELGLIGRVGSAIAIFAEKPTLEFANDTYYVVATKTKQAAYTHGTAALTPDMEKVVDWFTHTRMAQLTYFKVTPGGAGGPTSAQPPVEEEEEWTPPVEDNTGNTGNNGNTGNTGNNDNTGNTGNNDNTGNTPEPSQPAPTQPAKPAPTEGKKDPAEVVTPNATEKEKDSKTDDGEGGGDVLMIVIIVACVLAVGGSGFAVYWFVLRKPKK